MAEGSGTVGYGGRLNYEKIIQNVNDRVNIKVMFYQPFQGIRQLFEEEWGATKIKRKDFVKIVPALPRHAQEFPVLWVDWDDAKSRLNVSLCHKGARAMLK